MPGDQVGRLKGPNNGTGVHQIKAAPALPGHLAIRKQMQPFRRAACRLAGAGCRLPSGLCRVQAGGRRLSGKGRTGTGRSWSGQLRGDDRLRRALPRIGNATGAIFGVQERQRRRLKRGRHHKVRRRHARNTTIVGPAGHRCGPRGGMVGGIERGPGAKARLPPAKAAGHPGPDAAGTGVRHEQVTITRIGRAFKGMGHRFLPDDRACQTIGRISLEQSGRNPGVPAPACMLLTAVGTPAISTE